MKPEASRLAATSLVRSPNASATSLLRMGPHPLSICFSNITSVIAPLMAPKVLPIAIPDNALNAISFQFQSLNPWLTNWFPMPFAEPATIPVNIPSNALPATFLFAKSNTPNLSNTLDIQPALMILFAPAIAAPVKAPPSAGSSPTRSGQNK